LNTRTGTYFLFSIHQAHMRAPAVFSPFPSLQIPVSAPLLTTAWARRQDIATLRGAPAFAMLSLLPFACLADSYYASYELRHSGGAPSRLCGPRQTRNPGWHLFACARKEGK
jgi:hypothetical protein